MSWHTHLSIISLTAHNSWLVVSKGGMSDYFMPYTSSSKTSNQHYIRKMEFQFPLRKPSVSIIGYCWVLQRLVSLGGDKFLVPNRIAQLVICLLIGAISTVVVTILSRRMHRGLQGQGRLGLGQPYLFLWLWMRQPKFQAFWKHICLLFYFLELLTFPHFVHRTLLSHSFKQSLHLFICFASCPFQPSVHNQSTQTIQALYIIYK